MKKYRKLKNLTLQELADKTGLTHGYVRDLECLSIDKTPLLDTLGKFAKALDIDIRQLFDEVDSKNKDI
ncbi:MAG: helix-turn-helix transcriptional regulator [Mycoplasmatota bacterium]|nr:helix-turn-helix transcriptional regulator [Mycoplasmatota bacterium]